MCTYLNLQSTRLGKTVNEFRRKVNNDYLAKRAKALVKKWRETILIPEDTSQSSQQHQPQQFQPSRSQNGKAFNGKDFLTGFIGFTGKIIVKWDEELIVWGFLCSGHAAGTNSPSKPRRSWTND